MDKQYRTVKLPFKMINSIETFIKAHPECGYNSKADFVKDSVRHHMCWQVHGVKLMEDSKEKQP